MANLIISGGSGGSSGASYIWPCSAVYVTQEYGNAGHTGMDIANGNGMAVWASAAGTVIWVQNWDGHTTTGNQSYGNCIMISHGSSGMRTLYAHLKGFASGIYSGATVRQGQIIGYTGLTGNTTGYHLHFEMMFGNSRVNPRSYINASTRFQGGTSGGGNTTIASTPTISPSQTSSTNGQVIGVKKKTSITNDGVKTPSGSTTQADTGGQYEIVSSVEISSIEIHTEGDTGDRLSVDPERASVITEGAEIIITNGKTLYLPMIEDGITLQQPRSGSPATLKFKIVNDGNIKLDCGNAVSFKWNTKKMFFGYIFSIKASSIDTLEITAYDQMRYLKNKNTYVFKDKTFTEILTTLCKDNGLKMGKFEKVDKKITLPINEETGLDWITDATNYTVRPGEDNKSGSEYVVYDDFGEIRLVEMVPYTKGTKTVKKKTTDSKTGETKEESVTETYIKELKMLCSGFVDNTEIEGFTWEKTIDDQDDMSNQLKLAYDDDTTGVRHVYVYNNADSQKKYGTLVEYFNDSGWEDKEARDYYVKIWKQKRTDASKKYSAKGVTGATDCRGGSFIICQVDPGMSSEKTSTFMLVEEAKHTFEGGRHTMDLTLRGGEYNV